jgi:hypothetical protein
MIDNLRLVCRERFLILFLLSYILSSIQFRNDFIIIYCILGVGLGDVIVLALINLQNMFERDIDLDNSLAGNATHTWIMWKTETFNGFT